MPKRQNTTLLLGILLLDSGNCTNLSENGEQGNKVKAKEVEA